MAPGAPDNETPCAGPPIDRRDAQAGLELQVTRGANRLEKCQRLVVAAKQHVLPVVHQLAGVAVAE